MATFPTGTEITNLANSGHTAYNVVLNEKPASSTKMQALIKGVKDSLDWLKNTLVPALNGRCLLSLPSSVAIGTGAWNSIPFGTGTEIEDSLNMHDTVSNNSRITIPAGYTNVPIKIYFYIKYADVAAGTVRAARIVKNANGGNPNGDTIGLSPATVNKQIASALSSGGQWSASAVIFDTCTTGNYYELQGFHDRGSNLNVETAYFAIERFV